ncbi:SPP1 family predicted phage head-tail adaptor [Pararhizobium capsulatum DSM 1112]|uniref:SPP1 family predicted phage head-tail adaptor n=1 Tax=Pararhizobium capsulatum DSM 1112 TaxID=1121113 RepID=A0ABU0BMX0_9HYPH|nr:phage head closure protein [Pararhizobium capsulatum]MDQ0319603.1 SPP1 family predicted phage head-tail adaptor [Pararhizobium capsulatum DSM 1112]
MSARLDLERLVATPDGQGGEVKSFEQIGAVWARVEPLAAVTTDSGGVQQVTVTHEILVRHRGDLVSGMRFAKGLRRFLVQTVHDPDEDGRYLICRCTEEGQ